jgi:hypothetical protein
MWECRCDCGLVFVARADALNAASAERSCWRCTHKRRGARARKYDKSCAVTATKIYRRWWDMISRCHDTSDSAYKNYGARGIYVCEEWRRSFGAFLKDMGRIPSDRHSLGRIDNDGPYSAANCRWETPDQQSRNRRNTRRATCDGVTRCIIDWAPLIGMSRSALCRNLKRAAVRGVAESDQLKSLLQKAAALRAADVPVEGA